MGLKRNIAYNSILTLSNYLFGLLLLPYVSRTLGVDRIGIVDFVSHIVSYAIIIASLGIPTIGIRAIAKSKNSREALNSTFSSMICLNLIYTLFTLVLFTLVSLFVDAFSAYRPLLLIGAIHIFASPFLIEWLYKGLEDFRYITYRNISVRLVYVLAVFLFVNSREDYILYYGLTVGTIVLNAAINICHASKYATFSFSAIRISSYFTGSIGYGAYLLLTSMYSSLSVIYLGLYTDTTQVGYYSIAIKLFHVIVGFFSAFTAVVMARSSALIAADNRQTHRVLIEKSMNLLLSVTVPIIVVCEILAPQIIGLIAGEEFLPAVPIMRIIMPLVLFVGLDQILAYQVLVPLERDKWLFQASLVGLAVGCTLNILLVKHLSARGTAWALLGTELVLAAYYLTRARQLGLRRNGLAPNLLRHLLHSIPYAVICLTVNRFTDGMLYTTGLCGALCTVYFLFDQFLLLRNEIFINLLNRHK